MDQIITIEVRGEAAAANATALALTRLLNGDHCPVIAVIATPESPLDPIWQERWSILRDQIRNAGSRVVVTAKAVEPPTEAPSSTPAGT